MRLPADLLSNVGECLYWQHVVINLHVWLGHMPGIIIVDIMQYERPIDLCTNSENEALYWAVPLCNDNGNRRVMAW
jgi:hypothetical protein